MMSIGERIKVSRNQKSITQQELATQLNVSRSAISNWEVGRNYPDLDSIVLLSDILEVTLDELLREDVIMIKKVSNEQRKSNKRKKILRILIPSFIISLFVTGALLYSEVRAVSDFFTPQFFGHAVVDDTAEWTPVIFSAKDGLSLTEHLNIDGVFQRKVFVGGSGNQSSVEVRITDIDTNEVLYEFEIAEGVGESIEKLKKEQNYLVEIKAREAERYTFIVS